MIGIEHIGIAVKELEISIPLFEKLLSTTCYKTEEVASEQVKTAFFKTGETKIELLESTNPDGVIANFIAKKVKVCTILPLKLKILLPKWKGYATKGFNCYKKNLNLVQTTNSYVFYILKLLMEY